MGLAGIVAAGRAVRVQRRSEPVALLERQHPFVEEVKPVRAFDREGVRHGWSKDHRVLGLVRSGFGGGCRPGQPCMGCGKHSLG